MNRVVQSLVALVVLLVFSSGMAWAVKPAPPELTLGQALEMAGNHSKNLRKAKLEVDRTGELREHTSRQLDYVPLGIPDNPQVEVAWSSVLAADLTWQMSKRSLSMEEDQLVLSVCQEYWDVLQAGEKTTAKAVLLNKAEWDLRKARASAQVGMVNELTLSQAEAGYAGAEAELATAENELAGAYAKLNQLIGLRSDSRWTLVDTVEFTPAQAVNADMAITRVLEHSPAVWLAREKATMQGYLENLMFYTGEYRPYQARKIEVEQAELDAVGAADGTRLLIRSLYHNIQSVEQAYPVLEETVRLAEESLRLTHLRYDLGMATKGDVAAAEAVLAEAEYGLLALRCQHAYLKLALEKPWAMSIQ